MEPKDFARVVLRRKSTVIAAMVVVMLTAFFGSLRKEPTYLAGCQVQYVAIAFDPTNPQSTPFDPLGSYEANAELMRGPEIGALAAVEAKLPVEQVVGKANVENRPNTPYFDIQVADPGHPVDGHEVDFGAQPHLKSALICNSYATAYAKYRQKLAIDFYENLIAKNRANQADNQRDVENLVRAHLEAKRTGDERQIELEIDRDTALALRVDLRQKAAGLRDLLIAAKEEGTGARISKASGGGVKVGGDAKRSLMLGALVGFMFGIGIAMIREYMDDTVRDKESTVRELGIPVLAALPASEELEGLEGPSAATVEAARTLRASLSSLGFPHEKSMLVITSTLAKRRATVLAALAGAVAESGRTVLVIGSDLRGGRTHEAFGIANSVGLANVARGQITLERAVRPAPGMEGVYVLPCGPIIGNPGELLSSEQMAFTLRQARRWADVVLLDAPPVLAAADSSILGAYADGVLMVVSAGQTNRAQASEAKEQLVAAGARVLGAVLVGSEEAERNGADSGGYGDDLPQLAMYGSGAWGSGAYDADGYTDWYGDEVLTATARTEPRARSSSGGPKKKTAAASTKARPTKSRDTAIRKPQNSRARTAKSTGTGRASTASSTRAKPKQASPAKKTTAKAPARRTTTARTTVRTTAKGSTRRTR
jgi:capsular exopolysaccharide synthesis family protein